MRACVRACVYACRSYLLTHVDRRLTVVFAESRPEAEHVRDGGQRAGGGEPARHHLGNRSRCRQPEGEKEKYVAGKELAWLRPHKR